MSFEIRCNEINPDPPLTKTFFINQYGVDALYEVFDVPTAFLLLPD